ncbi:nuclear transport factor 2 family protein [Brevundimonas sp. Root1423]|uniref:nuclear transport factor 2 family protein n=1 Tax=Brevundimonas sp. Root1423 TaxID=1736462 RepID=UPI001F1D397A|nr:nuclear transport factor 2 family protein [Brevundimonas sp. Root1423]
MRSVLIAALLLTGGPVRAAVQTAPAATAAPAQEAANQAVVEELYRAFAANDAPAIARVLDENVVWTEAEGGPYADRNPYRGLSAVFDGVFGRIGVHFRDFRITPETFLPSGNRVVVLGRYAGTEIVTREPLDAQFAHVFTVANGKVTAFQQYTDTAGWIDAVTPD